eukprot:CAMPEP_0117657748 /NCGR_PEP_ID=MMETSP0804-20121206/5494_1 /TAXON_ID=1074897 /ORGANISM="Tetraselmis astigmatica, Strain CCMP880" /LENGTH=65 /DNA_ID=CAMNT_0005464219 /DNA_START=1009 /DNA_END=1206 /DNA_ORIENTATION=-
MDSWQAKWGSGASALDLDSLNAKYDSDDYYDDDEYRGSNYGGSRPGMSEERLRRDEMQRGFHMPW